MSEPKNMISVNNLFRSQATFETLVNAMPQMVWSALPDGFHDFYNLQWYKFTGVAENSTDGEGWANLFHPEDQPLAWEKWRRSLATGEIYEVEYRLRHHSGIYRWTLGRAMPVRDKSGRITRWIGTCTDIHAAKSAAESNEVLSHELSHRIKNIFQVISGLISLVARGKSADVGQFANELRFRIAALARAHEFARPHSKISRPLQEKSSLTGILNTLFAPYPAFNAKRIIIHGVDIEIDDRAATPIAMVIHELTTNAVKYGALSNDSGKLNFEIRELDRDRIELHWQESGGPTISQAPASEGFGSRLIALSVCNQLGGTIERQWKPGGLTVSMIVEKSRFSRSKA